MTQDQENESLKIKAKKINLLLSDGIITSEIAKEMLKNLINNPGDYVSLNACSDSFRGLTAEQRANQVQKSKVDAASSARMKLPFFEVVELQWYKRFWFLICINMQFKAW